MNRIIKFVVLTGLFVGINNCSSSERSADQSDTKNSSATIGNTASTAGSEMPDAGKNQPTPFRPGLDPENLDRARRERLANVNAGNGKSDLASVGGGQTEIAGRPAPDDSVITTAMDQKTSGFIETRTFKSHPSLAKVEFITYDADHKEGRIYLRNGKIIKLPPDKNFDLMTAAPQEFLDAVGISPPATAGTKNAEIKKKSGN